MRFFFFSILLVLLSCSSKSGKSPEKKEAFKRYDYRIAVTTGSFYSAKSKHNDTAQILFPKQNCDTLFALVNLFFKDFSFNNVDTVGKDHEIIEDDAYAFVELSFNGRKLIAHASSINNRGVLIFPSARQLMPSHRPIPHQLIS